MVLLTGFIYFPRDARSNEDGHYKEKDSDRKEKDSECIADCEL